MTMGMALMVSKISSLVANNPNPEIKLVAGPTGTSSFRVVSVNSSLLSVSPFLNAGFMLAQASPGVKETSSGVSDVPDLGKKARLNAVIKMTRSVKKLINELNQPVNGDEKDFKVSFKVDIPYSFKWPYRPFRITGSSVWRLRDFILLSGTMVSYKITYKEGKDPDVILRTVDLSFEGASKLHGGFWGPVTDYEVDVFPTMRTDRLVFTEAFNKKTGKKIDDYYVIDRRGKKKISYNVKYTMSFHDRGDGKTNNGGAFGLLIRTFKGRMVKYRGHTAYVVDLTPQMYGILNEFRDMPRLIAQSKSQYNRTAGKKNPISVDSAILDLSISMWNTWLHGMANGNSTLIKKIIKMEGGLKSS